MCTPASAAIPRTALPSAGPCGTSVPAPHSSALFVCRFGYPSTVLLSCPDSLSGLFFALLGVYLFFTSFATKLHFFLGVFLHFITGDDSCNMGLFTKDQTAHANVVYKDVHKYLAQKDGKTHVVMVNSYSKFVNALFCCEDKYTTQIDTILSSMQADGYEILDVKVVPLNRDKTMMEMQGYSTLITYK
jgi:hypothetical protein